MKRINQEWWKGSDGYYREVEPHVYEGPFASMDTEDPLVGEDSTVIESGFIVVYPR